MILKLNQIITVNNIHIKHLDNVELSGNQIVQVLKLNNVFLPKISEDVFGKYRREKVNVQSVGEHYQVATLFHLQNLTASMFNFIERLFPIVSETQNFFMLDFNQISKILVSCGLNVSFESESL